MTNPKTNEQIVEGKRTAQDFVREIVFLYHNARKPLYPHERIFRGESRSVASEVEDLFARYLLDNLPKDIIIYVNQTITTGNGNNRQRIKPDLVIVKGDRIIAILDLKMDLGYKRTTFLGFWEDRDKQIPKLRGKKFSLFIKKGSTSKKAELIFDNNAKLYLVLISNKNINKELLDIILQKRGQMEYSDLYVLTEGLHPNTYNITIDETVKQITINDKDFDSLLNTLFENIKT